MKVNDCLLKYIKLESIDFHFDYTAEYWISLARHIILENTKILEAGVKTTSPSVHNFLRNGSRNVRYGVS